MFNVSFLYVKPAKKFIIIISCLFPSFFMYIEEFLGAVLLYIPTETVLHAACICANDGQNGLNHAQNHEI